MNKRLVIGLAGVVVILGALMIGFVGLQYSRYLTLSQHLAERSVPIKVAITSPDAGATGAMGTLLVVDAEASGLDPVVSLELWANGVLVGVQAGPAQGMSPMEATFAWIPKAAGDYTLIARATDLKKQTNASLPVAVTIRASQKPGADPESKTNQPDDGKGIPIANGAQGTQDAPIPAAVPLPQPPAPPGADASSGPAQPFQPSVGDFVSQITTSAPPTAPALAASVNSCNVRLDIQDNSNGEEGFYVYRATPSVAEWDVIATLAGQSANQWLTYDDKGTPGALSYIVSAFNAQGEASSNVVSVNVNAADCPQASNEPVTSISLGTLESGTPADKAYCYESLDDVHWSRLPSVGFFVKNGHGFDTQNLTESIATKGMKSVALSLDCWGWMGDTLKQIGTAHQDGIDLQKAGNIVLKNAGLSASLSLALGPAKVMGGGGIGNPPFWNEIIDLQMPEVVVNLDTGVENCKKTLPSKGQDFVETFLFCFLYTPQFSKTTQPFLSWQVVDGNCATSNCNSLQWYKNRVAQYGGTLGFKVHYADPMLQPQQWIEVGSIPVKEMTDSLPPLNLCSTWERKFNETVKYRVSLFYAAGPNDPDFANTVLTGAASGFVDYSFTCPLLPTDEVVLDVSPHIMELKNVQDGDWSDPQDVELYGFFFANTTSFQSSWPYGKLLIAMDPVPGECPSEASSGFQTNGTLGCRQSFKSDTYGMRDVNLCNTALGRKQGDKDYLSPTPAECNSGDFGKDKDHMKITVRDGDALVMQTLLIDYDSLSADDPVCIGMISVGPYSLKQWNEYFKDGWEAPPMVQPDNNNAACRVWWMITSGGIKQ